VTVGPVGRNEATAEFFDFAARGELMVLRCADGHHSGPRAQRCEVCGSGGLEPVAASGRAKLVSWAVAHRRDGATSTPAIVELEEGPWWWTALVDGDAAALAEGLPLQVGFERPEGSETVPVFRPAP
jgi:uncharacterized OB-fold protein